MTIKLMAGATIDKGIDDVLKRGDLLAKDVHKWAVQALLHAEKHGDPRKLNRLVVNLHKAMRPAALQVWVETYSPIRWNGDGKVGLLKDTAKKYTPFNVEGASANPYWNPYWNPAEKVGKPLTLAALRAMINQMAKKLASVDDGKLELGEGESIVSMRAYVNRMKAADDQAARMADQNIAAETEDRVMSTDKPMLGDGLQAVPPPSEVKAA